MRIGTTTGYAAKFAGQEGAVRLLADIGFEAMDFTFFGESGEQLLRGPWSEVEAMLKRLKAVADERGIAFGQIHTPFPTYVGDEERDADCFTLNERALRACAVLDCPYAVVHPRILPTRRYKNMIAENKAMNMDFYTRLLPALEGTNTRIAIENMFAHDEAAGKNCETACSTPEELCDYIDSLNALAGAERFVACLDVGHAQLLGISPADFARALGKRLRVLHIHDNDGLSDRHQAPFTGIMDWAELMKALSEIGYPGVFSFEAGSFPYAFGEDCLRESEALLLAIGKSLTKDIGVR